MEIMELLQKAQKGDRQSRNQIVEENVGLVWSIVKRFAGRGYDQEDIFQIGCIGLIKAIDRFDVQFQVKFSTYAVPMITGEIKRFLRDDGMIKVSRTLKEQSYKVRRTAEKISQENGRNATLEEVAAATELSREEIVLALEAIVEPVSLYEPVFSDGDDTIYVMDMLSNNNSDSNWLEEISFKESLKNLSDREKKILSLRFFKGKTQMEVAKEIGISQAQVSRIEKGALNQIKKDM